MTPTQIGRRSFVATAAAFTLAACGGGSGDDDKRTSTPGERARPRTTPRGGLTQKGINYDTGVAYFPDLSTDAEALTRRVWRTEYVRREIDAIRDELHCNSILVFGSNPDRLMEAATLAANRGLYVWIEPQMPDLTAAATVDALAAVARAAEELRAEHPDVGMGLGCELSIFMDGLVPGDSWTDRFTTLTSDPVIDWPATFAAMNTFLAEATTAVRGHFGGQITYSSGPWEEVDWGPMDVVGVDLYRSAENAATYEDEVRALARHNKPVAITEFGCPAYQGADESSGDAWNVVDDTSDPPIAVDLVRDEQVQADYIDDLLQIFEANNLHGAFVYSFIEPDSTYYPDPHYDLDMVGYGVVKCHPLGTERAYDTTGEWDPKAAFQTVADHYS